MPTPLAGPARAEETFGPEGWGLILSAESCGLIVTTVVLLRRRLQRPLVSGMLGMSLFALPLVLLGVAPMSFCSWSSRSRRVPASRCSTWAGW